jgi:hypothetical protein
MNLKTFWPDLRFLAFCFSSTVESILMMDLGVCVKFEDHDRLTIGSCVFTHSFSQYKVVYNIEISKKIMPSIETFFK